MKHPAELADSLIDEERIHLSIVLRVELASNSLRHFFSDQMSYPGRLRAEME